METKRTSRKYFNLACRAGLRGLFRLFFVVLAFAGCTVELEVELEQEEEILAVYAFVEMGSNSSTAIVEPSVAFNEGFSLNQSKLDEPARLQLFRGDALWAEYGQLGQGVFYSASHPPIGQELVEWEMVVSHPDFGEGKAMAQLPVPGRALSASLKDDYPLPDGGRAGNILEVKIQDPGGVRNYYEIALLNGPPDDLVVAYLNDHLLMAAQDTLIIPSTSFSYTDRWLFYDEIGDGEAITVAFGILTPREELGQPWLSIRYVPEEYYNYMKGLALDNGQILELLQGIKGSYSNFSGNVFGVFALYSEEQVAVD